MEAGTADKKQEGDLPSCQAPVCSPTTPAIDLGQSEGGQTYGSNSVTENQKPGLDCDKRTNGTQRSWKAEDYFMLVGSEERDLQRSEPRVQQGHAFYTVTTKLRGEPAPRNCCSGSYYVTIGVFRMLVIF